MNLPLFPLGTVLFPGGWLPLQIFEVRYLDMVQRCHERGEPFGVVTLSQGSEVQRPAGDEPGQTFAREAFHPVGTLAHIDTLERPQPGLLLIGCRGGERFQLSGSEKLKHGLWMGQAEVLPADASMGIPDDLGSLRELLLDLGRQLHAQHPDAFRHALEGAHWDDAGWIANRWCDFLPESNEVKLRLLALDNPLLRLELVGDLVDKLPRA
jgi:Lon protease-like protein